MIESYIASLLIPDWAKKFVSFAWKFVAAALVALVVFVSVENRGARKAVAKIEKQDATHVQKAQAAGARSRDPRTRGVLDPYQRPDD